MKLTKKQHFAVWLLAALMITVFTGCQPKYKYSGIEELSYIVETEKDLVHLDEYPDLKRLDLSGSTLDHVRLGDWIAIHPWIDITYSIPVGGREYRSDTAEISLSNTEANYEELMQSLKYLPELCRLTLHNPAMTPQQIAALEKKYEDVEVSYTADLLGQTLDGRIETLDLSHISGEDVPALIGQLNMFAYLTEVELTDESGRSSLSPDQAKLLMEARPDISFHYVFDLFGKKISTTAEKLEYVNVPIGNDGVEQLRQALNILPDCSYLKLDSCGIDSEILAKLRQEFPGVNIVWRVYAGEESLLTDVQVLKFGHELKDDNCADLAYCTQVKHLYIDSGNLTDFSFIASMPLLESATLSRTYLSDLSSLAGCSNLVWLEIAECSRLKDLSPLKDLPNLKYLNVSKTGVEDLSVLKELPLTNLMCLNSKVPQDQRDAAQADHPDALVRFGTGYDYGYGWRFEDYNRTPCEYYKMLDDIFDQ